MQSRRKFLHKSILRSAALMLGNHLLAAPSRKLTHQKNNPVVVATLDFSKTANLGAWEVLKKGGRALDAVEAGVRIPEAGPTNQTIEVSDYGSVYIADEEEVRRLVKKLQDND